LRRCGVQVGQTDVCTFVLCANVRLTLCALFCVWLFGSFRPPYHGNCGTKSLPLRILLRSPSRCGSTVPLSAIAPAPEQKTPPPRNPDHCYGRSYVGLSVSLSFLACRPFSIPDLPGFLVCPPLGAGVAPGARGGGCDGESVEARHPVVPFSSRLVGSYAHDPRVEERTHTSQKPEAP